LRCAVGEMQGWRTNHEDAHAFCCEGGDGVFWVLDGHGGEEASRFCAPRLKQRSHKLLQEASPGQLPADADFSQMFTDVDQGFRERCMEVPDEQSGSTVIGAVIRKQQDGTYSLKLLNCGDSRAVVVSSPSNEEASRTKVQSRQPECGVESVWPCLLETIDHKPNALGEKARIEAAGGMVTMDDPPRLDGNLAVSRGLGDFEYKSAQSKPPGDQKVSCIPEIYEVTGLPEGSICILACDGLWDVASNAKVSEMVHDQLKQNPKSDLGVMAAQLIRKALQENSRDNITVMIIQMQSGLEWAQQSTRFNPSDEMMFFDKLGDSNTLDDDLKKQYNSFLRMCDFPQQPVQCSESGRWYSSMWKCPKTGKIYCNRHNQKKGWAKQQRKEQESSAQ